MQVNVAIMRAFVSLRRMLAGNEALASKIVELERRLDREDVPRPSDGRGWPEGTGEGCHRHDVALESALFDAIRELMAPPAKPRREIGFHASGKEAIDGGAQLAKLRL